MKISKNTLNLFSSFTSLNNSLLVRKGNIISTTNVAKEGNRIIPVKSVLVMAEVEEKFPIDFGIYDLKQFLQVIDTFDDDPEFEFEENYVKISEKNHNINYAYCAQNLILSPSVNTLPIDEVKAGFVLDPKTLGKLKKLSNVMKHDDLFVRNSQDGKNIELVLTTTNEASGENYNEYIINIEKEVHSEFNLKVSMKNITLVATDKDSYSVEVSVHKGKDILVMEGLGESKIIYYISSKR